jgi:hypothetical protein
MGRRPAEVSQADIARTIRAMRDAGLTVVRVVVRRDGVAVETTDVPAVTNPLAPDGPPEEAEWRRIVL